MRDDLARLQPGAPAPRAGLPGRDIIFVLVAVALLCASWAVFAVTKDIPAKVDQDRVDVVRNREVGYQSRAAVCDLQKGIGLHESQTCADPHVARYRDPNVIAGSTASSRSAHDTQLVLCALIAEWRIQGISTPVTTLCPKP